MHERLPPPSGWDPVAASYEAWASFARLSELGLIRGSGRQAIAAARQARLEALVAHARTASPFYRERYARVPAALPSLTELPPVGKRELMARFDDWGTDRAIRRADVMRFVADRASIGDRFLGRYAVWKSSGSTGEPGLFVHPVDALSIYDALVAVQLAASDVGTRHAPEVLSQAGRAALIAATDDHYATIATFRRLARVSPWLATRCFSVLTPLPELVGALNAYRPAFLAGYPTALTLLADEQRAGRLRLRPANVWAGGECLTPAARTAITSAFGCGVVEEYGASECLSLAYGCREGWLHVNADWVILEPVDRMFRPTPAGQISDTVLLTNLANSLQPIIRYNLGDSVLAHPEPCACGNPLPAIRVEGRHDDVLEFADPGGRIVRVLPLAITTAVEEAAGVHRFQLLQVGDLTLLLRLTPHERRTTWPSARAALRAFLDRHGLPNVEVALDESEPVASAGGAKLRQVIAASARDAGPLH